MVHLISLELVGIRLPDESTKLESAIKELGESYSFSRSTWIVESAFGNKEICAKIVPLLKARDRILVTVVNRDWVAANIPQDETDWLSQRNFAVITPLIQNPPRTPV